jgi:hypothetical protein
MLSSRSFKAAALAVLTAFVPLAASAAIGPGSQLSGQLDHVIDSGSANVGDPFRMYDVASQDGSITGATIYGHVSEVQRAGQGARPQVELAFDRLVTASGRTYLLHARVTGMTVKTKNNAGREVLGAVGGAVLGGLLGKGIGAALGAGGGYLYTKNYHTNVSVPAGSVVNVQVTRFARQA